MKYLVLIIFFLLTFVNSKSQNFCKENFGNKHLIVIDNQIDTSTTDFQFKDTIKFKANQQDYRISVTPSKTLDLNCNDSTFQIARHGTFKEFLVKGIKNEGIWKFNQKRQIISFKEKTSNTWLDYLIKKEDSYLILIKQ